jgi:hypothetical protein
MPWRSFASVMLGRAPGPTPGRAVRYRIDRSARGQATQPGQSVQVVPVAGSTPDTR